MKTKKDKILFTGGAINTLVTEEEHFRYMGTENGRIIYLGNSHPGTGYSRVIDLKGRHVFPAMIDAHLHLTYSVILAASSHQICHFTKQGIAPDSLEGIRKEVEAAAQKHKKKDIIVINGYIPSVLREKRLPTRYELDLWTGGRQIIIYSIDGHSSALSTSLMQRLGFPVNNHDGILKGEAHEFNQGKITALIARSVTPATLARGIARFTNTCYRYGISHVCAMDGSGDLDNDIITKAMSYIFARMDIGVRLFAQYMDARKAGWFYSKQKTPRTGGCGQWETDGSVGSHSAAFYQSYKDNQDTGKCYYTDQKLNRAVTEAVKSGSQVSCHAIGSKAIDQVIRVYTESLDGNSPLGRHRIDHFEFPSKEAIQKVSQLNLALTIQPGFAWIDRHYLKSYEQYLPEQVLEHIIPLKTLTRQNVCLCGSSDSPVQEIDPFLQMLGMIDYYQTDQSLTMYEALRTYTINGAEMLGESDEIGTLELEKKANFFVCRKDLLQADKSSLMKIKVDAMFIEGKKCREKKGSVRELIALLLKKGTFI